MPTYLVRVGTPDGQIIDKQVQARNLESAKEELRRKGMHIFQAKQRGFSLDWLPKVSTGVSTERFLHFNQELLALIRAGLPIIQSLDLMLERQKNPRFRQIIAEIRDKIQSGVALSDAFAAYGDLFPPIYSNSLRAGERSGDLESVIRRFLRYQKLILNLKKKLTSALIYPLVLIVLSMGMIFVMLTYVIPKFSEFYAGFDAELPVVTRILITVSGAIRQNVIVSLALAGVLAYLIYRWSSTATGGVTFDRFKLKVPMIGGILHRFALMQYAQSLGTLLGGGTPMVPAIEIASQSVTNKYISETLAGVPQSVREGAPLWHSLETTGVMSDLVVEMIKVGESTGALVEMLTNISEFYDEEIDARLARMIALIEPIILVFLGIVIAGLLYAFYLPLFQLAGAGQR